MKPKYKVGEKVFIILTYFDDVLCPCCGEIKHDREQVRSVSIARVIRIDKECGKLVYLVIPIEAAEDFYFETDVYSTRKEAQRVLNST